MSLVDSCHPMPPLFLIGFSLTRWSPASAHASMLSLLLSVQPSQRPSSSGLRFRFYQMVTRSGLLEWRLAPKMDAMLLLYGYVLLTVMLLPPPRPLLLSAANTAVSHLCAAPWIYVFHVHSCCLQSF